MKKLFILLAILSVIFAYAEQNTCDTNNTKGTKPKQEKEDNKELCKKKKYCKNMSSCEEAKFYLEVCKYTSLDKDGDGIPCENVCK